MENVKFELEELKNKYEESEAKRRELEDKNSELAKLVAYYEECFRLNQHRQFGQSSEKSDADSRQILLVFDEAENEAQVKKPEQSVEEITYSRSRRSCTTAERKISIHSL
jgi:cell shape-determining protein MreC